MFFEDLSINTGLSLGLVPKDQYFQFNHQQKTNSSSEKSDHFFPSLTLALSSDHQVLTSQEGLTFDASKLRVESKSKSSATLCNRQASSISASFSNPSIKREREVSSEEVEVEKVSRKVISDDLDEEEISGAGKKLRLAIFQTFILEDSFKGNSTLNPKQKKNLAKRLNLRPRQVEVWFQNRRARSKLKRAELDSELLKKCYEKLTVENGRLQKELQELKALKRTAPPFYMQLPETTPTICPSCERTGGSFSNENSSN